MRTAAKVDSNQREIVSALRQIGATVQILSMVGKGCPDILVGFRHNNFLFEIKDSNKPPSKRKLTPDERQWHDDWRGQVTTISTVDQVIALVTYDSPADVPPF